jgi:hypothetical protein
MVQAIISRLAGNSFLIKGWAVTLVTAVLALQGRSATRAALTSLALVPIVTFWLLDGHFLYLERLYRELYENVRTTQAPIDFSLSTRSFASVRKSAAATLAPVQLLFYAALVALTVVTAEIVARSS